MALQIDDLIAAQSLPAHAGNSPVLTSQICTPEQSSRKDENSIRENRYSHIHFSY
jgi:hypothetical protein